MLLGERMFPGQSRRYGRKGELKTAVKIASSCVHFIFV